MDPAPLISVLLPSYNYGRYIGATIESVLAQTCGDFELIISDDASTDDSREVIRRHRDPRIRFVEQPRNLGNIEHFARMYALCRGRFVAYVDSDDAWEPAKLERQLAAFAADPSLALVATHIRTVDGEGRPRPDDDPVAAWFNQPVDLNDWASWLHQNRVCMSSILARKEAHDAVGVRRAGLNRVADLDLWIRFRAAGFRLGVVPEPLTVYRVHGDGLWGRRGTEAYVQEAFVAQSVLHPALRAAGRRDLVAASFRSFLIRPEFAALPPRMRAVVLAALAAPAPVYADHPALEAAGRADGPLELGAALEALAQEFLAGDRWRRELAEALDHARGHGDRLSASVEDHQAQAGELSRWIDDLKTALRHEQARAEGAEGQLRGALEQRDELRRALDAAEEQRTAEQADRAGRAARIAELERALDWTFIQRNEAEQRVGALEAHVATLQEERAELRRQPWFREGAAAAALAERERLVGAETDAAARFHLETVYDEPAAALRCFRGWAFAAGQAEAPVRARALTAEGQQSSRARRLPRPDVAAAFPGEPGAGAAGFEVEVPLATGDNLVCLEIHRGGAWRLFHRAVVTVEPAAPFPALGTRPTVAVVVPCYNYGRFVGEAVASALAQTWTDLEIVVVDDGSTDPETVATLDRLAGPRVRLLRTANRGLPAARNHGIRSTTADLVCCLDADDRLEPTYVEKCLFLLARTGADIAGSWQQNFGLDDSRHQPGEFTLGNLWWENRMINAALYRRALWERVGGYDEAMTLGYEDWEFWMRCARAGARATAVPETLFHYRKHGRSMIDRVKERHGEVLAAMRARHYVPADRLAVRERLETIPEPFGPPPSPPRRATRPRVLLALPWTVLGGVDTILSQICRHLAGAGIPLTVVTTERPLPTQGDTTALFTAFTPDVFHLPRFLAEEHWATFLRHLVQSREVSHLWIAGSAWTYEQLPALHDAFPHLAVVDLLFNTEGHTRSNRRFAHHLDLVVCENASIRDWLLERGEFPERVRVVPNGVDLERFRPRDPGPARAALAGLDSEAFVVGFLGRFSHEKAADAFLHLAARLAGEPRMRFVLAGAGPAEEGLRALERELGLRDVLWPGVVDSSAVLPAFDVLVVPSRLDGRPNAVLEAMACGVPVVASRIGGLPELVADGETGFLTDPLDLAALEAAVRRLAEEPRRREAMGRAARRRAEQELDVRRTFAVYEALFRGELP